MSIPVGWYSQPDGRERWWDGYQWTEDFAPAAKTSVRTSATGDTPVRPSFENGPVIPMSVPLTPAPQVAPVPVQVKGSNGLAIAGFVLALLGALSSVIPIVDIGGDFLALLGLIFGVIGLVQSGKRDADKGLSIAAIILAVVAFVVSIVVSTSVVATVNKAVKNLPSASGTPSASGKPIAKVGDTITLNGMDTGSKAKITAVKVVDPTTSTDGISTPAAGSRYVAVEFQIQNTGTVPYEDAPDNGAKVIDTSGHQFDSTTVISVSAGPLFEATVTLRPGEKAVGYTVFEVPKTSRVARVQFAMDSGYADSGQWTVK